MKKLLVVCMLLLSLTIASLSHAQGTMYVSSDKAFACSKQLVMKYMMLLFLQDDLVALNKVVEVAISKGDLIYLRKGEKVHYLAHDDEVPTLVWIRRQGDPIPVISFGDFFK